MPILFQARAPPPPREIQQAGEATTVSVPQGTAVTTTNGVEGDRGEEKENTKRGEGEKETF